MRPHVIEIEPPGFGDFPRPEHAAEHMLVEALVPEPASKALRERILHRLAKRDVMPVDIVLLAPVRASRSCRFLKTSRNMPIDQITRVLRACMLIKRGSETFSETD